MTLKAARFCFSIHLAELQLVLLLLCMNIYLTGRKFKCADSLIAIVYKDQVIYIKYILTHAEYDKDEWKNDPYFKP
ncbi:hypothetical protein MiAbB_02039 [Microcystis aeruginosa NIES-4285]|uniref:Type II toxin-antitoxin system HigB family toxin n=1 Tax=Microcystis aeruginosa NIES-4285 TaxID=2497681 RepID=A0A402DD07_MICAE|nr:hypothetical protein MiAbB_02039 [Microcystis aeruginosa NIES-4285]